MRSDSAAYSESNITPPRASTRGRPFVAWFATLALGFAGASVRSATIVGFAPDRGGPGTEVTITGTGLQTSMFVYFGSTEATGEILSRSATAVRARVPPNALTGQLSIFTSGSGSASSLAIFVASPRVESFTPGFGAPGSLVTLSGANFGTGQFGSRGNVTSILFNGQAARFDIAGINQLLALVPTNATTGPITVANEAGNSSTLVPFHVAALVASVSPTNGMPGDAIEISGANLGTALQVEFGLERSGFSVVSSSVLLARVPTNAINGRIQVTTPAGAVATPFSFVVRPRVIRFQPEFGNVGTNVVIDGGGFHGVTGIEFNGTRAAFNGISSTRINATVPSGAASGPIRVVTTNGTFTTEQLFHLPARITAFGPASGRRGDIVTLDGQNLAGTTRVSFNGAPAEFTIVSPTRLAVVVPGMATTGRLAIESPTGPVLTSGTFNVIPILDGFSPALAPPGSTVTLAGAGLTNLAWVRIAETDASFSLIDPTRVRVVVPLDAFSGRFRIRNVAGVEVQSDATFFVEGARPVVSGFSPAEGADGTTVLIRGRGFLSASRVQFNGVEGVLRSKTAAQVEAMVPTGASTGPISVTTLDGIAVSDGVFVFRTPEYRLEVDRGIALDEIVLRWPIAATGFVLQSSASLGPLANWTTVTETPIADGATFRARIVMPPSGRAYYRLAR